MSPVSGEQQEIWRNQDERLLHRGLRVAMKEGKKVVSSLDQGQIMGAANSDGEIIEFKNAVFMGASIEKVLRNVEQEMKLSVSLTMQ